MNIKPIGKKILVKEIFVEEKTTTGIILSTTSKDKNYRNGNVISIGDDEKVQNLFKVGDEVIFSKNSGVEINNSFEKYFILELDEVLGIIQK